MTPKPNLDQLAAACEANKDRSISTTQLWLNQNELLFAAPALVAMVQELRELCSDRFDEDSLVTVGAVREIINKHVEVT